MRKRRVAALAAALAILPAAAAAQQGQGAAGEQVPQIDTSQLQELDKLIVPHLGIEVGRLDGMDIVGPTGEEVGEVEDILVDRNNRIVAVVAEIGGFLGIGDRDVVIPLTELALQSDGHKLSVPLTREQFEALPEWKD